MRKYVLTLAVLAAATLPSLAMAGDATQGNATVTAGPAQMSDAEMDNVTAGSAVFMNRGGHEVTIKNPVAIWRLEHNKNFTCVSGDCLKPYTATNTSATVTDTSGTATNTSASTTAPAVQTVHGQSGLVHGQSGIQHGQGYLHAHGGLGF